VTTAGILSAPAAFTAPPASPPPPNLQILSPGLEAWFLMPMTVNVVFVGYEQGSGPLDIDEARFTAGLPQFSASWASGPLFYGRLVPTNVAWTFDYRVQFTERAFEDEFFGYLAGNARARPLTAPQNAYNREALRSLDIDSTVEIDAPLVERWLADNAGSWLSIDTSQPTVFFVNWWGRADFRFHVYGKRAVNPDNGNDIGSHDSRKLIAWGGTPPEHPGDWPSRVWFHDLSAGPDAWTRGGFRFEDPDIDGDGIADYRIPPTWEYGNTRAYRPFDDLSGDLSKVLRYVAIDLLFAPWPVYPPVISPPKIPTTIDVTVNRFVLPQDIPGPLSQPRVLGSLSKLQPWNTFSLTHRVETLQGQFSRVFDCWVSGWNDPQFVGSTCYGERGGGFAASDLPIYTIDHLLGLTVSAPDLSIPTLIVQAPAQLPILGVAQGDPRDGSQLLVFGHASAEQISAFGTTTTLTHEVGHYLGLFHPHDGWDYDRGPVILGSGDFFFSWTGDQTASVMSYMDLSEEFSQFELDSMARWLTAGYLNRANYVLARIEASPRARQTDAAVLAADGDALAAVLAYVDGIDYQAAAFLAKSAYDRVMAAAAGIGVPIEPEAKRADMKAQSPNPFFVDPIEASLAARLRENAAGLKWPAVLQVPKAGASAWTYETGEAGPEH
jgi:hypothetical protein